MQPLQFKIMSVEIVVKRVIFKVIILKKNEARSAKVTKTADIINDDQLLLANIANKTIEHTAITSSHYTKETC